MKLAMSNSLFAQPVKAVFSEFDFTFLSTLGLARHRAREPPQLSVVLGLAMMAVIQDRAHVIMPQKPRMRTVENGYVVRCRTPDAAPTALARDAPSQAFGRLSGEPLRGSSEATATPFKDAP